MKKIHVAIAAILVAIGAVFGVYALTRTTQLGAKSRSSAPQNTNIAQWTRELNAANAALVKALAEKPPPLPAPGQRIRYVRPQPIVVTVHVPNVAQATAIRRGDEEGRGD